MNLNLKRCAGVVAALVLSAAAADAAGMLTAKNGMTLYVFDKDKGGVSSCYDSCAKMWPPYAGKAGAKMAEGWTELKRKDGALQWAYDGKPVYFYAGDKKKGDATGNGMGGVWHTVVE